MQTHSANGGASVRASSKASSNLGKFGFAERRHSEREQPGQVTFDDLGNAQYQWADDRMLEDSVDGETRRQRALALANLVLVEDEPPPDLKIITANAKGLRVGYNTYESGKLEKKEWKKKRDLRALSQWIEARKKVTGAENDSEESE